MSDQQINSETLEAILFIPGFSLEEKNSELYYLGKEFEKYGAEEIQSFEKNDFKVKQFRIDNRLIDVYEVYWLDLIEDVAKLELTDKVPLGIITLLYWLFSGIYRAVQESELLILLFTVFLSILVSWYLITILLIFSQVVKELDIDALKGFKPAIGWIWLINTFLVGLLPVNEVASLANFCRCYLEDDFFQYKLNERISRALNLVFEENYSNITVVGHSLGAVLSTSVLANVSENRAIRYITFGNPTKFFSLKSRKIQRHLSNLVEECRSKVSQWVDYYSEQDLVCIKWLPVGKYENLQIKSIHLNDAQGKKIYRFSFVSRLGQSHRFYIYNAEIIRLILNL